MATYYVDSAVGSDASDGSSGSPWLTLQHALDNAVGAEQHTFALVGSFTISTALDFTAYIATVSSAEMRNLHPIFDGFDLATLTLSVAGAIGQTVRFRRLNIVNTLLFFSGSAISAASNRRSYMESCVVTSASQANFARIHAVNCDVTNARIEVAIDCILRDTIGSLACPIVDNGIYVRCKIATAGPTTNGYRSRAVTLINCSIYAAGATSIGLYLADQFTFDSKIFNCAIHTNGSPLIDIGNGYTPPILQNTKIFGGAFANAAILDLGGNGVLSGPPFADPANDDFTPSAELISMAVDGVVPGAIQPASGGVSRPINPFLQQVIG